MRAATYALAALLAPGAGLAQAGDPVAGARQFERQCASCHVAADASGEVLAGRNGRIGPNLYGVAGRVPGAVEGFAYSETMERYGATGAVWEEANLVPYVQDPTGFLREALGEPRARGKMAYRVRDPQDAQDLWAFLATLAPAPAEAPSDGGAP